MPDRPFISVDLDRRIATAHAAIAAGKIDAATAEANLKPWAAAEAWLAGDPCFGISPRDRQTFASDICPIDDSIATLIRARDRLGAEIETKRRLDLIDHWRGIAAAVRQLERQRDGMIAFRAMTSGRSRPASSIGKPGLPQAAPSLLADMFDGDGNALPLQSRQAA